MALDTTYTSPTYDSFFTVAEMDDYVQAVKFQQGGDQKWLALSETDKEILTKSAVSYINGLTWEGTQNVDIVVLTMLWPRDPYGTVTPDEIGYAMACYMLRTINVGSTSNAAIGAIKKKKVAGVEVEYETGGAIAAATQIHVLSCAEQYAELYLIPLRLSGGIGGVGLGKRP